MRSSRGSKSMSAAAMQSPDAHQAHNPGTRHRDPQKSTSGSSHLSFLPSSQICRQFFWEPSHNKWGPFPQVPITVKQRISILIELLESCPVADASNTYDEACPQDSRPTTRNFFAAHRISVQPTSVDSLIYGSMGPVHGAAASVGTDGVAPGEVGSGKKVSGLGR